MIGRAKTIPMCLRPRLSGSAKRTCRPWVTKLRPKPRSAMPGQGYLRGFFAFTASSAQITKNSPPNEHREAIYDSQLSQERSRSRASPVLRHWLSRNTDRSGLRRSTIVRRFSHDLLHRLGTGIIFRDRARRRDSRLPAWVAQTASQSALLILAKRFALPQSADSLLSLQPRLAPVCAMDLDEWLA